MRPPCCSSGGGRETSQPDSVLDYSNTKRKGLKSTPAPSSPPPSVCTGKWLAAHQKSVGSGAHRLPSLIARASTATRGFRLLFVWWYCGLRLCLSHSKNVSRGSTTWPMTSNHGCHVTDQSPPPLSQGEIGLLIHWWLMIAMNEMRRQPRSRKKSRAGGKAQFRSTPRNYGCR